MTTKNFSISYATIKEVHSIGALLYSHRGIHKAKVESLSITLDSDDHKNAHLSLNRKQAEKLIKQLQKVLKIKIT